MIFSVFALLLFGLVHSLKPAHPDQCLFHVFLGHEGATCEFTFVGLMSELTTESLEHLMLMFNKERLPGWEPPVGTYLEVLVTCHACRGWNYISLKTSEKGAKLKVTHDKYNKDGKELLLKTRFAYPRNRESWIVEFSLFCYGYENSTVVKLIGTELNSDYLPNVPQILYDEVAPPGDFERDYTCLLEQRGDSIWPEEKYSWEYVAFVSTPGPITNESDWGFENPDLHSMNALDSSLGHDLSEKWTRIYAVDSPSITLTFRPYLDKSLYHHMLFIYKDR